MLKTVEGDGWQTEVPDKGWLIEDGKVIEHPGDEAFRRSHDPKVGNMGQTIFWSREAAEDFLEAHLNPVDYHYRKLKNKEISNLDFKAFVGEAVALQKMEEEGYHG